MALNASIAMFGGDIAGDGKSLTITAASDIDALVDILRRPEASTATIESETAALDAHVEHGFGYFLYSGEAAFAFSQGDPESPAVIESEVGFPQGAGVSMTTFVSALNEFLADSRTPPPSVSWRDA